MASKSFSFTISVTDSKDTATATVTINVIDVNEAPSFHQTSYSVTGDEDVVGLYFCLLGFLKNSIYEKNINTSTIVLNE